MPFLLLIAGVFFLLRGPATARAGGIALVGIATLWLFASAASLTPRNIRKVSEIRREQMSTRMTGLLDSGWFRRTGGKKGEFDFPCGHCGTMMRLVYHPDRMGMIFCPHCAKLAFWMQLDEQGNWRTMPEYFEGTRAPFGGDPAALWLYFLSGFSYDHQKANSGDPVWQSAPFTMRTMKGVCRDSATAVADWLHSAGHDACVAVGNVVGLTDSNTRHAWTVARISGVDYVLETAGATAASIAKTPPRAAMMPGYFPNSRFAPDGVWATRDDRWIFDYKDPVLWYQVKY
jgi:hypothetical protein